MLEESPLHGCFGCVGAVKEHMADVGVVQPRTSERHTAQVHVRSLGSDLPVAQVRVRKVECPWTWVGVATLQGLQSVGKDVRTSSDGSVLTDALQTRKCMSSFRGR